MRGKSSQTLPMQGHSNHPGGMGVKGFLFMLACLLLLLCQACSHSLLFSQLLVCLHLQQGLQLTPASMTVCTSSRATSCRALRAGTKDDVSVSGLLSCASELWVFCCGDGLVGLPSSNDRIEEQLDHHGS